MLQVQLFKKRREGERVSAFSEHSFPDLINQNSGNEPWESGFFWFFFCLFAFPRAALTAYGGSQARGLIGAVATSLRQSYSNSGSELRLQPTPQLTAALDP